MESGKVPRGASGILMVKEGSEHFKELPPRRGEIKAEISEGILKPVATTILMEMRKATLEDPRKEDMETISTASIETSCAEVCNADLEYEALFPVYLDRCFLYYSLFPLVYEFEKDTLVQLWIAQDFIEAEGTERMEDTGSRYFDELFSMKLIVPSRFDGFIDDLKYKLSDAAASCHMSYEEISTGNHLRVEDGKLSDASAQTLHLSLLCEDIDQMAFEAIKKCKHLRTLLLLREYRSRVKQVPREIFLQVEIPANFGFESNPDLRVAKFYWECEIVTIS
ncbi:hypothetical protein L1049_007717 [Liquidambar formosana]|uniref:Disease resistance protein winged helix domain-containing protein n=1 Tax=Liquidambar formosana TaxID=63359 RepID=A0AAP0S8R0_LIQFO